MQKEKTIVIILNKNSYPIQLYLDQRITNFGLLPLQSEDYSSPFELSQDVASSQRPFDVISRFAEAHNYSPTSPRIKLPISSSNYKQIVDSITYEVCERYTNLQNAEEAEQVLSLAKFLQFHQLQKAIAAAIAVNYYTGFDEKQIEEFMKKNNLQNITVEEVQQIYEENKQIFQHVELRAKKAFLNQSQ